MPQQYHWAMMEATVTVAMQVAEKLAVSLNLRGGSCALRAVMHAAVHA